MQKVGIGSMPSYWVQSLKNWCKKTEGGHLVSLMWNEKEKVIKKSGI